MISKFKYEYLLFFIAVTWALFFSFVLQLYPGFSITGDDGSYLYSAKLLYLESELDNTRPLLISAINGLPFLFGYSSSVVIKWGIFINFCSWFFTSTLLFKIISERLNRRKAFLFSIFFILCIGNLSHAFNFISESIFIFMIVFSIYFVNKYYQTEKYYYITLAVAVLLLNSLIKPVSIGLALILIIFFIKNFREIILNKFSFLLFVSIFLIFFQMYSLKKNYGDFTLSYISSITYYNYLGTKADCYKNGIEYLPSKNQRIEKFGTLSSHEMKNAANDDIKYQIQNNATNLLKAYLYCIYSNSSKGNYIVSECKNEKGTSYFTFFHFLFKSVSKLQNIVFTIIGVFLSFLCIIKLKKENKFFLLISTFILYVFFISAMSCLQCDRFHIAFFPLFIILLTKFKKAESI